MYVYVIWCIFGLGNGLDPDRHHYLSQPTKCPLDNKGKNMGEYEWTYTTAFSLN